jgi:hypothetical protein
MSPSPRAQHDVWVPISAPDDLVEARVQDCRVEGADHGQAKLDQASGDEHGNRFSGTAPLGRGRVVEQFSIEQKADALDGAGEDSQLAAEAHVLPTLPEAPLGHQSSSRLR